jgi:hypothetical protein
MAPIRCPVCGLVNPAESGRCDCGYRFNRKAVADTPGVPVEQHLTHQGRGLVEQRRSAATTLTWFGGLFIAVSLGAAALAYVAHVPVVLWIGGLVLGGGMLMKASRLRPPRS